MRDKVIESKLSVLLPQVLKVENVSHMHNHHAGSPNSGQSHYNLTIKSTKLDNLPKIKQHRLINDLLKDEFAEGLHALSIKVL